MLVKMSLYRVVRPKLKLILLQKALYSCTAPNNQITTAADALCVRKNTRRRRHPVNPLRKTGTKRWVLSTQKTSAVQQCTAFLYRAILCWVSLCYRRGFLPVCASSYLSTRSPGMTFGRGRLSSRRQKARITVGVTFSTFSTFHKNSNFYELFPEPELASPEWKLWKLMMMNRKKNPSQY